MKKSNTQPLKEVLHEYIDALKLNQKLREVRLLSSWEKFVGKTIFRATRDIYISDKKLYVTVNSSVIRNELHNLKAPLMDKLNENVGAIVIEDIILK